MYFILMHDVIQLYVLFILFYFCKSICQKCLFINIINIHIYVCISQFEFNIK